LSYVKDLVSMCAGIPDRMQRQETRDDGLNFRSFQRQASRKLFTTVSIVIQTVVLSPLSTYIVTSTQSWTVVPILQCFILGLIPSLPIYQVSLNEIKMAAT